MKSLFDRLAHYGTSDILPMHMPGHKRRTGFMRGISKFDITEVTGFDDLYCPQGILAEAMDEAAEIYGSDATFFLINGSTCGILSAITAAVPRGGKLLMARNCHKSALNAVILNQLEPVWLEPDAVSPLHVFGNVKPEAVEAALKRDADIKAVFLVSPSYEGIVSDIKAIAEIAHRYGVPLLVDAAHGAHFRFGKGFPADALTCGADIVVESVHKTLPSLTQTAVLHIKSKYVSMEKLEFALQTFQSSSPSYLLIASIIECLSVLQKEGTVLMSNYEQNLRQLRSELNHLYQGFLLTKTDEMFDYDNGKIVLGFQGAEIRSALLERYRVEVEMAAPGYIVAMTSLNDSDEMLFRFGMALKHLRRELPLRGEKEFPQAIVPRGEMRLLPAEAQDAVRETVPLDKALNRVAATTLFLYPPGCPLVAAGEIIKEEQIEALRFCGEQGFTVRGLCCGGVPVVK